MNPPPVYEDMTYKPSGKLTGKKAVITGGDSGIGRAVALLFAKEGADIAIIYLNESNDAMTTKRIVETQGVRCYTFPADLKDEWVAKDVISKAASSLGGRIDILVNNAAAQYWQNSILDISSDQFHHTFESNIYSVFYVTKAALTYIPRGGSIVNTASVTAFEGDERFIDYSASKGAVVSFTRSMAMSLVKQNIRVNAVAPGPVWTPMIVSSFSPETVQTFGTETPMGRPAQPYELAPTYVYLASDDSSNVTGQVMHVNGGKVIN